MPLLTPKSANELKTSYGDTIDKLLDFFDQKYHFLETFDTKTQKYGLKDKNPKPKTLKAKTKIVRILTPKRVNWLKTSYGDTFDKVLDSFDQKLHFLETFDTKTQNTV